MKYPGSPCRRLVFLDIIAFVTRGIGDLKCKSVLVGTVG